MKEDFNMLVNLLWEAAKQETQKSFLNQSFLYYYTFFGCNIKPSGFRCQNELGMQLYILEQFVPLLL